MRTAIKTKKKRTVTAATKRTEHRPPETYPAVGKAAPAFVLESDSGKRIRLSDFRGKKVVVLFFYPRDLTSGCTKEACAFRDTIGSRRSKGVQVLGVSADTIASHQKFRDKHDLSFPLLHISLSTTLASAGQLPVHDAPQRRGERLTTGST